MNALAATAKSLLGYTLSQDQIAKLQILEAELMDWNERVNLTAIRDSEGIRTKHFLDSLTLLLAWDRRSGVEIDLAVFAGDIG